MSKSPPNPSQKEKDSLQQSRATLRLMKATGQVARDLHGGNPQHAIQHAIAAGLKLAGGAGVFYNSTVNPLTLADALKKLGIQALGWSPEVLMAEIDRQDGKSPLELASNLESFHRTGILSTTVPELVRQKLYAIRVIATSNSAQTEWPIFEKVGAAFNDRLAHFGEIQRMSAAECARTVAAIENIRPDTYAEEIKIYIAACCSQDGLYTVEPVKWLKMTEPYLQQMNRDQVGAPADPQVIQQITERMLALKEEKIHSVSEDLVSIQATKLFAIDQMAEEMIRG